MKEGTKAPEFSLLDANGKKYTLSSFKGKKLIIYFYPRDNTPGCTIEAIDFTSLKKEFEQLNTIVVGISKDDCKSHKKFIEGKNLDIILLSDEDSAVQKSFGIWRLKKFMGKEFMGTVRSTFLISETGKILTFWDNVKAAGHALAVLEYVKALK